MWCGMEEHWNGGSAGLRALSCGPRVIPRHNSLPLEHERSLSHSHKNRSRSSLTLILWPPPPSVWDCTRIPGGAQPSAHPRKSASPSARSEGSHAATTLTASRLLSPVAADSLSPQERPTLSSPVPEQAAPPRPFASARKPLLTSPPAKGPSPPRLPQRALSREARALARSPLQPAGLPETDTRRGPLKSSPFAAANQRSNQYLFTGSLRWPDCVGFLFVVRSDQVTQACFSRRRFLLLLFRNWEISRWRGSRSSRHGWRRAGRWPSAPFA